ncbi:MAG: autotransporter-associated beta strand repeat-containing protein [Tepidisphaeraceae bacterium]
MSRASKQTKVSGSVANRGRGHALPMAAGAVIASLLASSAARANNIAFTPTNSTNETNAPGSGVYTYPYSGPLTVYRWDASTINWSGDSTLFTAGDTVTFGQANGAFNIAGDAVLGTGPAASMIFDGGANYVFQRASTTSPGSIGFTGGTAGATFDTYSSGSPFGPGFNTNVTLNSTYTGKVVLRARPTAGSTGTVTINGGTLEINDQNAMPGDNTPVIVLGGGTLAININTGNVDTDEGNRNPASSGLNNNATPLAVTANSTLANTAVNMDGVTPRFQNTMYNGAINIGSGVTLNVAAGGGTVIGGNLGGSSANSTLSLGNSSTFLRVSQATGGVNTTYNLGNNGASLESTLAGTTHFGSITGASNTTLRGTTSTAGDVTYSIGGANLAASYGGRIMNGLGTSTGGSAAPTNLVRHTVLTKVGTNTLTLSGNNLYSGATNVNAGTLAAGSAHAFGDSASNVNVATTATLDLNGQTQEAGKNYVLAGGSLVNNSGTAVTLGTGASGHVNTGASGAIEGTGFDPSVTITSGGGTGAAADVLMQVGWLRANAAVAGSSIGSGYTKAPIITFDPAPAGGRTARAFARIPAAGGGVAAITMVDPGYGYTSVPGFTITNAPGDVTGSGFSPRLAMSVSTILFSDGGSGYTSAPDIVVDITGAAAGSVAPSTLAIPSTLTAGFGRVTVNSTSNIGGSGNLIVDAVASGAGGLNKVGAGTVFLNAANTYLGLTDVQAGTLGGTGSIAGNLLVGAAGTVAPGASIESFGVGGSADIDGTFLVEFDGAGVGTIDLLDVIGLLDIAGATIDFNQLGASADDAAYVFASYGTLAGPFAGVVDLPAGYVIDYAFNDGIDSNNIALVPVPEPTAMAALAAAGLGLLGRRRRRVA